jgi:molybdate transport system substrate-binding protein
MLLLSGCGATAPRSATLTIAAAASLQESFTQLADAFAAEHPEVGVRPIVFDGSSTLATQLLEGAPFDVFASADEANMRHVADLVEGEPQLFASNTLTIAVAPGNPLGIRSLAGLADPGVLTVLCSPDVPCGAASRTLLELDGVTVVPVSEEQNVAAVLTKVRSGEADAGLVYVTDVAAAGGAVEGIPIAGTDRVVNRYPIAVIKTAADPDAARAFVDFVRSEAGRAILAAHGFGSP